MKYLVLAALFAASPAIAQESNSSSGSVSSAFSGVNIHTEGPDAVTGYIGAILGSENNSPCGRVMLGVPYSGHNCTIRLEAQAIYQASVPMFGKRKASQLAVWHLCQHDRSMRSTLMAAGVCRKAN